MIRPWRSLPSRNLALVIITCRMSTWPDEPTRPHEHKTTWLDGFAMRLQQAALDEHRLYQWVARKR